MTPPVVALLVVMLTAGRALAQDPTNGSPYPPVPPPPEDDDGKPISVGYGSDASIGVGAGTLLGDWPKNGVHTLISGRYDAFLVERDAPGPRLGASIFAEVSAGLLQDAQEDNATPFPFTFLHYGVLSVLRFDPSMPWTGLFGFGFSRLDLSDYFNGPQAIPMMTFETGVRRGLGRGLAAHSSSFDGSPAPRNLFLDGDLRFSWGSARAPGNVASEWWLIQGLVSVGLHAR
jgi:hypothetical protein